VRSAVPGLGALPQRDQPALAVRGHAHRDAVGGAVAGVPADPLHDLEEHAGAEHLRVEVQVFAVLVLVVEDRVLAHRRERVRWRGEAGVQVVVVVVGDPQQRRAEAAHGSGGGDRVVGGEGDVLRVRDRG
jgi:hypothetical protein